MSQQGIQQEYVGLVRVQRVPGAFPRVGAWAIYQGRVGIIAAMLELTAEFHLVDARGDTTLVTKGVPLRELAQATFDQIPQQRRPAEHVARKLGYLPHPDGPDPATPSPGPAIAIAAPGPAPSMLQRIRSHLTRRR